MKVPVRLVLDTNVLVSGLLNRSGPHTSDRPFAEAAILSGVQILVTGNQRHFAYLASHGINVLSPAEFLTLFFREDR